MKSDAGLCFTQFNELMETGKRPVDPNALLQAYVNNGRQLGTVTTLSAGCGGETKVVPDAQKTALCDATAQLKTCLTTVMTMQHDRLQSAAECTNQRVTSRGLTGTGLRFIPIEHQGNSQSSPEEANRVADEIGSSAQRHIGRSVSGLNAVGIRVVSAVRLRHCSRGK